LLRDPAVAALVAQGESGEITRELRHGA